VWWKKSVATRPRLSALDWRVRATTWDRLSGPAVSKFSADRRASEQNPRYGYRRITALLRRKAGGSTRSEWQPGSGAKAGLQAASANGECGPGAAQTTSSRASAMRSGAGICSTTRPNRPHSAHSDPDSTNTLRNA